jgi:hypothetical protein
MGIVRCMRDEIHESRRRVSSSMRIAPIEHAITLNKRIFRVRTVDCLSAEAGTWASAG